MSRLIDADELIKYIKIWEIGTSISSDQKEFIDCVNKQLTAFDMDKVLEKLHDEMMNSTSSEFDYAMCKAIEIVKGGGVE